MPETENWRLDPSAYPHRVAIQTRFQDVDMLGHINNVAMAGLFETARVRFNHALGLGEWRGHRWLIAHVGIDYLAEAYHPADVEIATGVASVGTRSWQLMALAIQEGRPVAKCKAVLVMEAKPGGEGLPAPFRQRLDEFRIAATR